MNLETVKQLKDAGFPIRPYPEWALAKDGLVVAAEWERNYVPTLSELIEACGSDFRELTRSLNSDWWAKGYNFKTEFASTPEETVAKLWLALNKK
jgi:hypothetical protein